MGRKIVGARGERAVAERTVRWLLREGLTSRLFAPAMRAGQAIRRLLPDILKDKVPPRSNGRAKAGAGARARASPTLAPPRKMMMTPRGLSPPVQPTPDGSA